MIIKKYLPDYYKACAGDTLLSVCTNFGINVDDIKKINKLSNDINENDIILLKEIQKNYYIVKPLDTLDLISKKLNVSECKLKEMNKSDLSKLFIGQKINY